MLLFVILVLLIAAALYGAWFAYRMAFYSRNDTPQDVFAIPPGEQYEKIADRMLQQIHDLVQLPFEQVYIRSYDGTRLAARYYHNADNAPLVIQFHGYRGNGVREFSGGSRLARRVGYNALVVDQRAHGLSEGHTISFGIKERFDCKAWAEYAAKRFPNAPIFLSGVSMGAATVLMASNLKLPSSVCGIIADCPYASPGSIIKKVCADMKLPKNLLYPFVILGALIFGRFCIWKSSAVRSVKETSIPILLIHGEDDRFVPCDMSKKIYHACAGEKKLVTVPSAGHGLCYMVDTEQYEKAFEEFISRHCK